MAHIAELKATTNRAATAGSGASIIQPRRAAASFDEFSSRASRRGAALRVEDLAFRIFLARFVSRDLLFASKTSRFEFCSRASCRGTCSSRRRPRVSNFSRALRVAGPALRVEDLAF
jgi:hypothetical protein